MTDYTIVYAGLAVPAAAFALDMFFGDPQGWPHPVRWLGRAADELSSRFNSGRARKFKGAACALALAFSACAVAGLVSRLPVVGVLFGVWLGFAGLALGALLREARAVSALLAAGEIEKARAALTMLVSRDVSGMDEAGLRRSLAETVSENVNDAFVAPFFWLVLAGPGGLWLYKAVSTLDSMWGYKTDKWRDFGWFAARFDDVLAFVPARVTAFVMLWAASLMKLDLSGASLNMMAHARRAESPNAGWPMSAAAWILGAPMGGPTPYNGQIKDKPVLGPDAGTWDDARLAGLIRLSRLTGLLSAAVLYGYSVLIFVASG